MLFPYNQKWPPISFDEEENLLKASPKWLQDIIVFAISTGLRQSEILDLKWSRVDLDRRTMTISEQKNKGVDTLPLNGISMSVLNERYRDGIDLESYVFPSLVDTRKGNRDLMKVFYVALEKSGVRNFRFHDLRHTFATRLIQNGVDLYTVQKLGRWKTVSMIQRYAHHYPESLRSAIEVMDGVKERFITNLSHSQKNRGMAIPLRVVSN